MPRELPLGPLMRDVEGTALTVADRERLRHPAVGAVILFARNYASPPRLAALVAEIHALRTPALLVAVDQEGGRVQRFREGFTRLPPAAALGRLYDENPQRGLALTADAGWVMAAELRRAGVDLSLAPVLDVATAASDVIGDRAFHADPAVVARLAGAFAAGMRRAGMPVTGKHFPGHGGVGGDTHVASPADGRALDALERCDLVPYRALHRQLDAVMTAHVVFPEIDPLPPTFSGFWLQHTLRGQIGFDGVVFSDDLSMHAAHVAGDVPTRARAALDAGCDMVLVCQDAAGADAAAEGIGTPQAGVSRQRLGKLRDNCHRDGSDPASGARWEQARHALAGLCAER